MIINFFSILVLNRKELNVLFKTEEVEIRRGDTLIASEIFKSKMYLLHFSKTALLDTKTEFWNLNRIKYTIDIKSKNSTQLILYHFWHI